MDAFFATLAVLVFISGISIFAFKKNTLIEFIRTARQPQLSIQDVHTTILDGIQNIAQLELLKISFKQEVNFSDNRNIFGFNLPFTGRKITILYNGYAVCGCDLNKIRIADSFFNSNHISITVPNSKIFHVVPNMESFKVFQDNQIFSKKINLEDQMQIVNADLNALQMRLENEGYIEQTNEKVRQFLTGLLKRIGAVPEISFIDDIESLPPPNSTRLLQ